MSGGYETVHRHEKRDEAVPSDEASRPSDGSIAGKKRHDTDKESSHELASLGKNKEDIATVIMALLKKTFGKDTTFVLFTDLHLTLEEYLALTEERFKYKTELHEGRLVIQSPASEAHEATFGFFYLLLKSYVAQRKLGRVYGSRYKIILSKDHSYEPDVFAISTEQLKHVRKLAFRGVPQLIVEIISPSSKSYDLGTKAEVYKRFGVKEYWTVNYETQTVLVFYLREDGQYEQVFVENTGIIRSRVFPGFWIEAEWLWEQDRLRPSDVVPILLESSDLAEYIKTHGVQKAIEALGVDLVLKSIDWERQPEEVLDQLPTAMLERLPDSVLERLPDSVLERLPDSVLERLPDSVLKRLPEDVVFRAVKLWPEDKKKRFLQGLEDLMSAK